MSQDSFLEKLKLSKSIEQKAGLIAESFIEDLPSEAAKVALWCGFLPWFSNETIQDMLGTANDEILVEKILTLPFVENLEYGYCFHATTRRGLLSKYRTVNPTEIQRAFDEALKNWDNKLDTDDQYPLYALYGYVISNQGLKAEKLLFSILKEAKIKRLDAFSLLDEAEEFCISDGVGLTSDYWFYRGNIYLLEEKLSAAKICADKAWDLDNKSHHAVSLRSLVQARLGNLDEALDEISKAIQARQDAELYRTRASIFMIKKDYKNSIFDYTRALRLNEKDIQAYIGRANTYLQSNKDVQAFRDLEIALKLSDDLNTKLLAHMAYALIFIQGKEFEKALFHLDQVIQISPSSGSYRRVGDLLFLLGRLTDARNAFEKALEFDNQNSYAYIGRGNFHLIQGDYEKAILDYEKALTIKEETNLLVFNIFGVREANLRLWEVYIKLGNINEAEKQKNILIDTENEQELAELLFFCRMYKLFDAMVIIGKKLVGVQSKLSKSYTPISYALNQLGDYEGALEYFKQDNKNSIVDVVDKINAGVSYWGLKMHETAMEYFMDANKELNKKPTKEVFTTSYFRNKAEQASKIWVKLMIGGTENILSSFDKHISSKDISLEDLYNLRDWGAVVSRNPEYLPDNFSEFFDHINSRLLELNKNSIYKFGSSD